MLLCMRTTLDLSDELLRAAKRRAADEGVSLKEIVERSLRGFLSGKTGAPKRYALKLKTVRGRLMPGVDLNDRNALFDLMDGRR